MAFLRDIPLEFIEVKGTERLRPKTVEYSLLIESISLISQDGSEEFRLINDPMDPGHGDFQEALLLLIEAGMKVEKRTNTTPLSPQFSESAFKDFSSKWSEAILNNLANGNLTIQKRVSPVTSSIS